MSSVSYRVMLDHAPGGPAAFRQPHPHAIDTRRRDATVRAQTHLSKRQIRWLRDAASKSRGVDPEDIVRAMVDLAMELEIHWSGITRPTELRDTIRDAVLIRHAG